MPEQLQTYFKEFLNEKFDSLHEKIDGVMQTHTNEMIVFSKRLDGVDKRLDDVDREQKWQGSKIWLAIGGISVIGVSGFVFSLYFKTLNKQQIEEAIGSQKTHVVNQVVETLEEKYDLR